jgi:hypothetical protein
VIRYADDTIVGFQHEASGMNSDFDDETAELSWCSRWSVAPLEQDDLTAA